MHILYINPFGQEIFVQKRKKALARERDFIIKLPDTIGVELSGTSHPPKGGGRLAPVGRVPEWNIVFKLPDAIGVELSGTSHPPKGGGRLAPVEGFRLNIKSPETPMHKDRLPHQCR